MNKITNFTKPFSAFIVALAMTGTASANMLLTDLTSINVPSFADREWKVSGQAASELQMECANCDEQILVNVRLGERFEFGGLGPAAAKKAKTKCNRSLDQLLQCDTIEGVQFGNVAGLTATKKILDDFYISSFILGDETTLVKMTTKASSKLEADEVSRQFFDAIKAEMIKK